MGCYSDPTAAKALGGINREFSRLEKKGFIEFRADPNDRRCKRIYILPKGIQCHEQIEQLFASMEQRVVSDFTPEEKEQFSQFLNRAIQNMGGSPCKNYSKEEACQ